MEEIYMTPEDFVGYDHVTERLTDKIWHAMSYFGPMDRSPAGNSEAAIKNAEDAINEAVEKINLFFREDWAAFQEEVEKLKLSPFEEYDDI